MSQIFTLPEKYHLFHKDGLTCRYGVLGLTREYYSSIAAIPPAEFKVIKLEIPSPKFRVAQIVVTAKCNLQCSYCSFIANSPSLNQQTMTLSELKEINTIIRKEGEDNFLILITGGEPELHTEAVNFICRSFPGTKILFTNGTLLMETRLRELNSMNLNLLFSLDGDAFAHNLARRSAGGSFRRVEKSLRMASKATMDFGISAVVGEHNIDNLPRLVQYIFEEFQPKSLGLNLPHYTRQQPWNRIEEYTEAIIEIYSYAKKYNLFIDQIHRRLQPLLTQKFRYRDCSAQGEKRVYFPGGIVSSCVNEFGLNNRNIDWANRIPLKSPECRECFAIGVCGGGCVFDGEAIYGQGRFDQRNCYFTRKFLEYLIWDLMDKKGEDIAVKSQSNLRFSVGHETI